MAKYISVCFFMPHSVEILELKRTKQLVLKGHKNGDESRYNRFATAYRRINRSDDPSDVC